MARKWGWAARPTDIKEDIVEALGGSVDNLHVEFKDGTVTLCGTVDSQATREKVVLLAGHVKSVENVDDQLTVDTPEPEAVAPKPVFYTVKSGDYLSKVESFLPNTKNKERRTNHSPSLFKSASAAM